MVVSLDTALALTSELRRRLRFGERAQRLAIRVVGSVRRREDTVRDLDLLVVLPPGSTPGFPPAHLSPARRGDRVLRMTPVVGGPRRQAMRVTYTTRAGPRRIQLDLFAATAAELPYAMFHYTGPAAYGIRVRAHAKRSGLLLNQYGVYLRGQAGQRTGQRAGTARTERDVARLVGVTWVPATRRGV